MVDDLSTRIIRAGRDLILSRGVCRSRPAWIIRTLRNLPCSWDPLRRASLAVGAVPLNRRYMAPPFEVQFYKATVVSSAVSRLLSGLSLDAAPRYRAFCAREQSANCP